MLAWMAVCQSLWIGARAPFHASSHTLPLTDLPCCFSVRFSIALLNTLAAAVPDAPGSPPRASPLPKVSAATAVRVSPVVGPRGMYLSLSLCFCVVSFGTYFLAAVPSEGERQGVCSPGPGVSFPYLVLGEAKPKAPVFHILVVNDFFDT